MVESAIDRGVKGTRGLSSRANGCPWHHGQVYRCQSEFLGSMLENCQPRPVGSEAICWPVLRAFCAQSKVWKVLRVLLALCFPGATLVFFQNIPTVLFPASSLSQWANVSSKTHSRALSRRRRRKTRRRKRRWWWFLTREHEIFTGNLNVRNPHLRLKLGLIKLWNWNDTKWLKKAQSQWWGDKMRRDKWWGGTFPKFGNANPTKQCLQQKALLFPAHHQAGTVQLPWTAAGLTNLGEGPHHFQVFIQCRKEVSREWTGKIYKTWVVLRKNVCWGRGGHNWDKNTRDWRVEVFWFHLSRVQKRKNAEKMS